MAAAKFPKTCRLKGNSEFRAVMDRRTRLSDRVLAVYLAANGRPTSRLGISVGRSTGGAVVRNRFKRLIREVWRQRCSAMPQGFDYVVMPANKTRGRLPTYEEVDSSFVAIMEKFRSAQQ
jgi:ribonuclease P protein component